MWSIRFFVGLFCFLMTVSIGFASMGTVKWFNGGKGMACIKPDDGGDDVFIKYPAGTAPYTAGDRVEYGVGTPHHIQFNH